MARRALLCCLIAVPAQKHSARPPSPAQLTKLNFFNYSLAAEERALVKHGNTRPCIGVQRRYVRNLTQPLPNNVKLGQALSLPTTSQAGMSEMSISKKCACGSKWYHHDKSKWVTNTRILSIKRQLSAHCTSVAHICYSLMPLHVSHLHFSCSCCITYTNL